MQKLTYRPDVDGLRALAILPVLWFHSGLPGLSGGFTGVDTFFVISGFLITSIIYREIEDNSFSFLQFYERRARRIGPALLTVVATTLIVGAILLLPSELVKLGESSLAALAMVPNIYFWLEAGYFRLGEGITPLLHTWSLGVEEQFYIFFPILLIVARKLNILRLSLWLLLLGSFALSIVGTIYAPAASFYLLPTRAWEMALGGILAVGVVSVPQRWQSLSGMVGIVLLVGSAIFITKQMPFPGWVALAPCLGAAMVIASGPDQASGRILSNPLLVWIGKISYSLYLWHWPVFVYLRHFSGDLELTVPLSFFGMGLSVLLAWLTYVFIEQPARNRAIAFRAIGRKLLAALMATAGFAALLIATGGLPGRHSEKVLTLHEQQNDHGPFTKSCIAVPLESAATRCQIGDGQATVAMWGDSHAAAMVEGVAQGFDATTVALAKNSCPSALDWVSPSLDKRSADSCAARNKAVIDYVEANPAIGTVVLASYWPSHARAGDEKFWQGVQQSIDAIRALDRRVVILAGTFEPGENVPWAAAIRERFGRPNATWSCFPAKLPVNGAEIIDLSADYCAHPEKNTLFIDNNHPSLTANTEVIAPGIKRWLANQP